MLNKISGISLKGSVQGGSESPVVPDKNAKPVLDEIIQDSININNEQAKPPSFLTKIFQYPSLSILPQLPLSIGVGYQVCKMVFSKEKMKKEIKAIGRENFKNNIIKKGAILAAAAVPIYFLMDYLNKKNEPNNINTATQMIDTFNKENKADVSLSKPLKMSPIIGAIADPVTGKVALNRTISEDMFLASVFQKPYVKHELVHMSQYILMGCSQDGVKKLNFVTTKNLAKGLGDEGKKEIFDAYQEIQSGVDEKYKNATIDRFGYKLNLVDYITAMYKVCYEKDVTADDLPIIINKEFYENAKAQRGPLSTEEEKKAQAYLEAYEKYPNKIGISQTINPNSDYKQNILEKEAFATAPWYAR